MDYDKVIVMDKGKVVEYDEPYLLIVNDIDDNGITKENGYLSRMIKETGEQSERALFMMAKNAYFARKK